MSGAQVNAPPPPQTANRPPPSTAAVSASGDAQGAVPGSVGRNGDPAAAGIITPPTGPGELPFLTPRRANGIPAARAALTAGDALVKPDYDRGMTPVIQVPAPSVPVLARPTDTAMPALGVGVTVRPASEMDAGTANATLNTIVANLKAWVANFPHPAAGEGAYVLSFFRGLASHQRVRTDAEANGQVLPADPVAAAAHAPAPEAFALRGFVSEARAVLGIYERAMATARIALTPEDQAVVDAMTAKLGKANSGSLLSPDVPIVPAVVRTQIPGVNPPADSSGLSGGAGTTTPSLPGVEGTTSTNQPGGPGTTTIATPGISGAPQPGVAVGTGTLITPRI